MNPKWFGASASVMIMIGIIWILMWHITDFGEWNWNAEGGLESLASSTLPTLNAVYGPDAEYAACVWHELYSPGLGIRFEGQTCPGWPSGNIWRFVVNGNEILETEGNYPITSTTPAAIIVFNKTKAETPDSAIRRVAETNFSNYQQIHCIVQPLPVQEYFVDRELSRNHPKPSAPGVMRYVLAPDDVYAAALGVEIRDQFRDTGDPYLPSSSECGPYQYFLDNYVQYFEFQPIEDNSKFIFVRPSEIGEIPFDENSIYL